MFFNLPSFDEPIFENLLMMVGRTMLLVVIIIVQIVVEDITHVKVVQVEVNLARQVSSNQVELVFGHLATFVGYGNVVYAVDSSIVDHFVYYITETGRSWMQHFLVRGQAMFGGKLVRFCFCFVC